MPWAIDWLATKLYLPPVRPKRVLRPRLVERLDAGIQPGHKLTLVSAPAGFGKTTLVSEWAAGRGHPVAWLSLDGGDNDLTRFLTYIVVALQTIAPDVGAGILAALHSPEPPPIEGWLTSLLNEIAAIPDHTILVLDDFHVIESQPVDRAVAFLLAHLPPHMHLIIVTRENPSLPLARYRVRGELTEVRAADLRFTPSEAAEFLNNVMALDLSVANVGALEARTEGWIAGLQLAALALQGLTVPATGSASGYRDAAGFIESFTGSHQFVMDYLVEEVLQQQPESVQTFLLHTAILDRLNAPLCDAVWIKPQATAPSPVPLDSQSILEYLERANLFLVPLDQQRQYYRYHHLFANMLRHRLQRSCPALLPRLHAQAAGWFEAQGNTPEAFEHWIAAGDPAKAAGVVVQYGYPYFERADTQQLSHWLERIPPALIQAQPWLCIFHSWGLIFTGRFEEAERYISLAERALGPVSDIRDPDLREQYGFVAASRAFLATRSLDGAGILRFADLAMQYIPPEKRAIRGFLAFFLGTGRYHANQYILAQATWREAASLNREAGNVFLAVNSLVALAELHRIQGKLHESLSVCREAAALAADERDRPLPVAAEVYVASARLHYEWNDLAAAAADFAQAATLMTLYPNFDLKVEYHTWLASLHLARGNPTAAADLIHEIEASDRQPFYKSAAAFLACRINYYLAIGDLATVAHIVDQHDWNLEDKNLFAWADAFLAYARVLIQQREFQRANDLLQACRKKLEQYALWTPALKALILQARISQQQGDTATAHKQIRRALTLAEPERFVRMFADENPDVAQLVSGIAPRAVKPEYARKLLAAFDALFTERQEASHPTQAQPLIEPLSPRELEILQLIAQGLSNNDIAERLFLALPTVKGHNRNIYGKLHVQRRTEAIARARELGLL